MKRTITLVAFTLLAAATNAQEIVVITQEPVVMPLPETYNRFAMDAQFGANHVVNPLADGYNSPTLGLFHVGLGGRYMLNPKFGLRLSVNYDQLNGTDGSPSYRTDYYRTSLEGVINLGNVLGFEQWTRTFGLLLHAGMGYSYMTSDDAPDALDPDHMMNVVGGLTPQFKVGERWNIYLDASLVSNANQDVTYDFSQRYSSRGLAGNMYSYSVGLQYNFGEHSRFADWVPASDRVSELRSRIETLERGQMDDDNDGVVNHIDVEPNTPAGAMVDTKGREIIWYSVYEEINNPEDMSASFIRYVNTYDLLFDTEKSEVDPRYHRLLDNIAAAMAGNTSYQLNLIGHADDRGEHDFNLDLSKKRAEAVKSYLVGKGVAANRITTTGVGETQPKYTEKTPENRAEERRVNFVIK
jgi:OmpA-OmpF porin, OOP family